MQLLHSKYVRVTGLVLFILFIVLLVGGFIAYSKRENLLHSAIDKATAKAKREYNLEVKIGSASFSGLSTVHLSQITVVPENRDSLLHVADFEIGIKIMPLLFGNIKLASVKLDNGLLNLSSSHGIKNYDFLFKRKKDTTNTAKGGNMADVADNLINQVLYKIPDDLDLKNFTVRFHDDSNKVTLLTQYALIKNSNLTSAIVVNNRDLTLHVTGKMRPSDKYIDVKLFADHQKVELPFIQKRYKLKLSFDTISTRLNKVERNGGETQVYGSWGVSNLLINQPRIASNDIIVPSGSIDANIFIGENYVSIDSSSVIHLKNISARPYLKYTLKPVKVYELSLHTSMMDAQNLFNSFPLGTFDALDGIKVAGRLSYDLNFYLDTSKPDDVQFDSKMGQDNFRIVKYGRTDLTKLNNVFVYTPYENGKPMPPRTVGPSNPDYTPLNAISPELQHAVMTAEDPSFYTHHGFVEESIRKSIAVDFKEKKFKRGGSTISMQLVKNAFLNREKTLARKMEETLIVWMIENTHIIQKQRMLEVYFNIIEWGHNVYGIGEASRYYFDKKPSQLNLGESIYLASIVPKPKKGLYSFDPDGSLKPYIAGYFRLIGNLMAIKGYTQRDSSNYGFYDVRLKASLRPKMSSVDTTAADSTDEEVTPMVQVPPTPPEKKPNFIQRIFGKKDTATAKKERKAEPTAKEIQTGVIDTAGKTKKQIRQEKRALKKLEKEEKKKMEEKGLF